MATRAPVGANKIYLHHWFLFLINIYIFNNVDYYNIGHRRQFHIIWYPEFDSFRLKGIWREHWVPTVPTEFLVSWYHVVSDIINMVSDIIVWFPISAFSNMVLGVWLFTTWRVYWEEPPNHISGIEWSISFFTNEVDMLERKRVKTFFFLPLQTIYFGWSVKRLTSWLWYCRCRWGW